MPLSGVNAFIASTSHAAQMVAEDDGRAAAAPGEIREKLDCLASAAHRMQHALVSLAGTESPLFLEFDGKFEFLRLSPADSPLPEHTPELAKLLRRLWADLEALRVAGAIVAAAMPVPKNNGQDSGRAKMLVRLVAESYHNITGEHPPGHKEAWFARYMQKVGAELQIECGHRPVSGVIRELKREAASR